MIADRPSWWRWSVCGLLLLATMLLYMDRQTLAQTSTEISNELGLSNEQYGDLEMGFGLAFAAGGIILGSVTDKVNVRYLYPLILIGWSLAGVATAYCEPIGSFIDRLLPTANPDEPRSITEKAYLGLMACRIVLGFFESCHWPCALVTTHRILSRADRTFGNSILQSGASVGAIFTPLVVQAMLDTERAGSWRGPFIVIGCVGMLWAVPWLILIRSTDLIMPTEPSSVAQVSDLCYQTTPGPLRSEGPASAGPAQVGDLCHRKQEEQEVIGDRFPTTSATIVPRFIGVAAMVITINLTWQFFRAWMPKFLRTEHSYTAGEVNYFSSAYYLVADLGCLCVGWVVKWLSHRGWDIHRARMLTFSVCCVLTTISICTSQLTRGPLLLATLLIIGFGALGYFPNYYAFAQELSQRGVGRMTGMLSAITWVVTSVMQKTVGRHVDKTNSYADAVYWSGLVPWIGLIAMFVLWRTTKPKAQ